MLFSLLCSTSGKLIAFVSAVTFCELLYYTYQKYLKNSESCKNSASTVNEVIFFTEGGVNCRHHVYSSESCKDPNCSYSKLRRIISLINSAKHTLDVCIYMITIQEMAATVKKVHSRGVRVRIIAETGMADNSGSKIAYWRSQGIPVRMKKSPYLMHHKFFIVDNSLLVTGSFNWTLQAISGNWDNVIITSERELVMPFVSEFERLWKIFSVHSLDSC